MSKYKQLPPISDFKKNGLWVKSYNPIPYTRQQTFAGILWHSVNRRTKGSQSGTKTYQQCANGFENFQVFAEWCQSQVGYCCTDEKGKIYQLDKDILCKGNKVYSPDVCVFVPQAVNCLLQANRTPINGLPIGVSLATSGNYSVTLRRGCLKMKSVYKEFKSPEQAFLFYKEQKEKYVKEVADFYRGQIDPRVYEALYKYEVDIDD